MDGYCPHALQPIHNVKVVVPQLDHQFEIKLERLSIPRCTFRTFMLTVKTDFPEQFPFILDRLQNLKENDINYKMLHENNIPYSNQKYIQRRITFRNQLSWFYYHRHQTWWLTLRYERKIQKVELFPLFLNSEMKWW